MENIIFFLAGAAITGLPILLWYFGNIGLLNNKKQLLEAKEKQLKLDGVYLSKLSDELGHKKHQLESDIQEFDQKRQQIIHEYEDKTVQLTHDFENKKNSLMMITKRGLFNLKISSRGLLMTMSIKVHN